ncbi:MAG: 1-acyl-sn-glycerol-3-phosphate acyltransferase [Anaerolineales bacterium]|nr:1-acyl-sn-glycerol-3-phosphate acyltransferase [Anaerolineales bacterium]MCX7609517.1 1-acyl-sn-glycerol-3-phosphate acyltransferase [Anaerolineales bacterium]MDW8226187.1 lysophospholipid acyltransferase family protein [Anaerolineales bacterium]
MRLKILRFFIRLLLRLLTRVEVRNRHYIPQQGRFVLASNHLGLVDAFLPFHIGHFENFVLLVGEKWEKNKIVNWLGKGLNFVYVDRFNPDVRAIREVLLRMKRGEILVITPEGTRSKVGTLLEGKPGVAYLAAKLGLPILPAGISGTFDPEFFGALKRLKRPRITVTLGPVFSLPPLPNNGRDEILQRYTDEIMCRIAALLPPEQRGVYADHPRLKELLESGAASEPFAPEGDRHA